MEQESDPRGATPNDPAIDPRALLDPAELVDAELVDALLDPAELVDAAIDPAEPEVRAQFAFLGIRPPHVTADHRELAERAAVADLAVRMRVSENTVRRLASEAESLQRRTPRVWTAFRAGEVSAANAGVVAQLAVSLPDDPRIHAVFDEAVLSPATELAPARFRERARAAREAADPEPLAERHRRAREGRRVWVEADRDGMAWFGALLGSDVCARGMARLDAAAEALAARDGETRSRDQLRADVFADLLTGDAALPDASPGGATSAVPRAGVAFAGCGRRAADCDLDHIADWARGGTTGAENLTALCRSHHRLEHETGWSLEHAPDRRLRWTSPTGATHSLDPPPF